MSTPTPDNHDPHHGRIGHVVEEAVEAGAAAIGGAAAWEGVLRAWKWLAHPAIQPSLQAAGDIASTKLKHNFKNRRPETWVAIQMKLRSMGTVATPSGRRNLADVLMNFMHHSRYPEYKVQAAIGELNEYCRSVAGEGAALQALQRLAMSGSQDAFDQQIDDLEDNNLEQVAERLLPHLRRAKVGLDHANDKAREVFFAILLNFMVLFAGTGIVARLHGGIRLWQILLALGLLSMIGYVVFRRLPPGFFGGLPGTAIFTNTIIGAGIGGLILLFAPALSPVEFVAWGLAFGVTTAVFVYILFGQPLYAFLLRAFTEVPYVGKPVKVVFEEFGLAMLALLAFDVAFPFGHFEEHPRLLVYLILATGFGLWAFYFKSGLQVIAAAAIIGLFVWGNLAKIEGPADGEAESAEAVVSTPTPAPVPAAQPEEHHRKSRRHRSEPVEDVVATETTAPAASDNNDTVAENYDLSVSTPTPAPASYQPVAAEPAGTVSQRSRPARDGEYHGTVVMDEFKSIHGRSYPTTLYLQLGGGRIVSIQADANSLIEWHGKYYQAWTLDGGEELIVRVSDRRLESATALSVPYATKE